MPSQQPEEIKRYHRYLEQQELERAGRRDEEIIPIEPCRCGPQLPFAATLTNFSAAARIGCQDDWINQIGARYGGDW